MLGDVHIAEPGALIGFAGPRVIEQTIARSCRKVPAGGISARSRHGRHGGASPRLARHHRPALPAFAEGAGRIGESAFQPAGSGVNTPRSGAKSIGAIQARLLALHPKRIDLSLGRIERILAALGHPERHLPR